MTILVLGATGKTGRRVLRRLREQGEKVRGASRSAETRFDWDDPSSWAGAVRDIESVYLIAPDDPAPIEAFVEQAVAAGVRRFVVLSGRGVDQIGEGFAAGMGVADRAVRASAAEWTILRANNFDQNFDEDLWRAPLLAGRLALPAGEVGEPFIDLEDVADVAAAVLTRPGHEGRIYDLSGPESLTFAQATEAISTAAAACRTKRRCANSAAVEWPSDLHARACTGSGMTATIAQIARKSICAPTYADSTIRMTHDCTGSEILVTVGPVGPAAVRSTG